MDKMKFMKNGAIWIAVITTVIVAVCGLLFGSVIEATLFEEIAKYAVMNLGIIAVMETLWYTVGQFLFHWSEDYKEKYGKGWFWKGIKEDLKNLKEGVNWLKVVLIYVAFFAVAGLIIWLLP